MVSNDSGTPSQEKKSCAVLSFIIIIYLSDRHLPRYIHQLRPSFSLLLYIYIRFLIYDSYYTRRSEKYTTGRCVLHALVPWQWRAGRPGGTTFLTSRKNSTENISSSSLLFPCSTLYGRASGRTQIATSSAIGEKREWATAAASFPAGVPVKGSARITLIMQDAYATARTRPKGLEDINIPDWLYIF